jgi:quinol-cytochrome oxidoreductase complex cytochrome b subunit
LTKIVLGVMVSMAIFLGALDWLFSEELRAILNRSRWAFGVAGVVVVAVIVVIVILRRRAEY